jgi:hypothetical protein
MSTRLMTVLSRSVVLSTALAAVLAAAACASPAARPAGSVSAADQFAQMKSLVGTWETTPESPMQGKVVYSVVGGGSSVVESLFPGQPHEMMSVYHLDGDQLMMTHYCAAGNQPTMRALPGPDVSEIRFEFVSLSNGDPSKDNHMHDAVLRFDDDGHLRPAWQGWDGGKPAEEPARMDLQRAD